jgi:hypothetical protein
MDCQVPAGWTLVSDELILLFEANPVMAINPPLLERNRGYRRAPIERALNAVKPLWLARAQAKSAVELIP